MNNHIINHFGKIGYKFINLDPKIKRIEDFYKFRLTTANIYDEKIIFYINLEFISKEISDLFISSYKLTNNKCTIYLKSDIIIINNNDDMITLSSFQSLLNIKSNNDFNCNICFNDVKSILSCTQCNFLYCKECKIKINNNDICVVCKYEKNE
jgi:hypothetical protein